MMELIKHPENNAKEKVFDDTDGYRLPKLSMYECVDEYLHGIVETLRNPHQRAEMSKSDVVHNSAEFQKEISEAKKVTKLYQDMAAKLQLAMNLFCEVEWFLVGRSRKMGTAHIGVIHKYNRIRQFPM